jgi:type II secretory pathway component GspD/PulD (secretin)
MKAREIFLIRHPFVLCAMGVLTLAASPRSALANKVARWTLSLRLSTRTVHEVVELVRALEVGRGGEVVSASRQALTVAGAPSEIERLVHIIREVDDPYTAGQRIWTIEAPGIAWGLASNLEALVASDRGWPARSKVPKFIPDDVGHRVIVMADEPGYLRVMSLRLEHHIDPCPDTDPVDLPIGPRGP